jgi:hypothetical protein
MKSSFVNAAAVGALSFVASILVAPGGFAAPPVESLPPACDLNQVFCVDENGIPLRNESRPSLKVGDPLTVAIVPMVALTDGALHLEADGVSPASTRCLKPDPAKGQPAPEPREIALMIHFDATTVGTVVVRYTRYPTCDTTTAVVTRPLTFAVGPGGYHIEAGILFPVVFRGNRKVETPYYANTSDSTLEVVQSTQAVPVALAFHYFPFGMDGGTDVTVFQTESCSDPDRDAKNVSDDKPKKNDFEIWPKPQTRIDVPCWAKDIGRWVFKPLAFEAGTTLVVNPFQQFFVGGGWGPIKGTTFSVGASFVQGQFLPPTYQQGMLMSTNPKTPFVADTRYMVRPYIGLTLSPDILGTLIEALNAAKKIAPVSPSTN